MRRYGFLALASALLPACGADLAGLLDPAAIINAIGVPPGRFEIPVRVRALCGPIFRDSDIQSIIIELEAARAAGADKPEAISDAGDVCQDGAASLLQVAENSDFEFDA